MTVNVKIVMMQHLGCDFVVVLIQQRLLLNIHIGYFSVVPPPLLTHPTGLVLQ